MRFNLGYDDFLEALDVFDRTLTEQGYEGSVPIHAIGGFALMAHGLRKDGDTADIDTVTPTLDPAAARAAAKVAEILNFPNDWLNNDNVYAEGDTVTQEDVDAAEVLICANFEPSDLTYDHIDLKIADLDTLARCKALAVCDASPVRLQKDAMDLCDVFTALDITDLESARDRFPWIDDPEMASVRHMVSTLVPDTEKSDITDIMMAVVEGRAEADREGDDFSDIYTEDYLDPEAYFDADSMSADSLSSYNDIAAYMNESRGPDTAYAFSYEDSFTY